MDAEVRLELELELDEPSLCAWAEALGSRLRGGDVLLLRGQMGAGKTTMVRALARGLGVARPERVSSPTYTICMTHPGRPSPHGLGLVHVDLFRLGEEGPVGAAAFESLGLEHDELPGPGQVLAVEWAELWADLPPQYLTITLARVPGREGIRRLELRSRGSRWADWTPRGQ